MKKATAIEITKAFTGTEGVSFGEFVAHIMKSMEQLEQMVAAQREAEQEMQVRHTKETNEHIKKWQRIRRLCPHLETTYYPDPSGNNDYNYSCDTCGASGKRIESERRGKVYFDYVAL